ncbi:methyltransferase FkbM family protein [Cylindrospermum sp. NIES-4074]|nr:methyltransferase FkbM family protein [Cylindrospermum sp. NIES-4074]
MRPLQPLGWLCAQSPILEKIVVWLGHRYPKFKPVSSLCWHTGEQIYLRSPHHQRIAVLDNCCQLQVTLAEYGFREIYFFGVCEPAVTAIVKHLAKPGQIWLDVGANVGYFTILLSKIVGETGKIYAFEPNPITANLTENSILLNQVSNVTLVREAVSNSVGQKVILNVPMNESVRASIIRQEDILDFNKISVYTVSLDSYLSAHEIQVDFMKVDIEGAEILAFQGMASTLKNCPPKVIVSEVSHRPECLATPQQLIEYLITFDYCPYRVRDEGLFAYQSGEYLHPDLDKDIAFVQPSALPLIQSLLASPYHQKS